MAAAQDRFMLVNRSGVLHLRAERLPPGDLQLELYDKEGRRVAVTGLKVQARRPTVELVCDTAVCLYAAALRSM